MTPDRRMGPRRPMRNDDMDRREFREPQYYNEPRSRTMYDDYHMDYDQQVPPPSRRRTLATPAPPPPGPRVGGGGMTPSYQTRRAGGYNKDSNDAAIRDLFYLWNDALATLDPDEVASRYSRRAILLATVSDIPRTDYNSIRAYFVDFLKKEPQGVILQSSVSHGDGWCLDCGIYEFTMGATGDKVRARYSFLYTLEDGEWKISHHHSSTMPEASSGSDHKKTQPAPRALPPSYPRDSYPRDSYPRESYPRESYPRESYYSY